MFWIILCDFRIYKNESLPFETFINMLQNNAPNMNFVVVEQKNLENMKAIVMYGLTKQKQYGGQQMMR